MPGPARKRRRTPRRGERARPKSSQPRVRGRGAKISATAARMVRAGHPWVFRESLLRGLDGVEAGTVLPILDEDGQVLGSGLVESEGAIAIRMLGRAPDLQWNEDMIEERIRSAAAYRGAHIPASQTAFRLCHAEGDGLPGFAVDRLGDYLLIYKYSLGGESYLDALVSALERVCSPTGIYMQDRIRPVAPGDRRPPAFHLSGSVAPPEIEVEEDGLRYVVDVTAPVSPGLFLDLRDGRGLCERIAPGREVLNLFSFTGAFALRALRAGATAVVNVDAAARSHARCRQNLAASGMDPEACEAITGDAFSHLERMRRRERAFDLVIVDPPPFSKVGGNVFSALKDYKALMGAVVPLVRPGGFVLAVSNAGRLSESEFLTAIGEGALSCERPAQVIGECGLPLDFPVPAAFTEGRYLKVRLLRVP